MIWNQYNVRSFDSKLLFHNKKKLTAQKRNSLSSNSYGLHQAQVLYSLHSSFLFISVFIWSNSSEKMSIADRYKWTVLCSFHQYLTKMVRPCELLVSFLYGVLHLCFLGHLEDFLLDALIVWCFICSKKIKIVNMVRSQVVKWAFFFVWLGEWRRDLKLLNICLNSTSTFSVKIISKGFCPYLKFWFSEILNSQTLSRLRFLFLVKDLEKLPNHYDSFTN